MKSLRRLLPDPLDVVHLAGVAAVIYGVWHIYRPAAWIVAGAAAIIYSIVGSAGLRVIDRMKQIEREQSE